MNWLHDHSWVVGVGVAAVLAMAGLAWRSARRLTTPVFGATARRRVDLTFAAAVLVTLIVGLMAVLWLLMQAAQVSPGKDRATLQTEAVKTGATIALGTGGAAFLLLAYRRQRLDEVDTQERRITELYTNAVEQLGHEKAPVRLGALYSLERLAQNNPEHRQTVIDVYCAYLRMPYTPPARDEPAPESVELVAPQGDDPDQASRRRPAQDSAHEDLQEELQVRQTAQRVLAAHLRVPRMKGRAAQRRRPSPRRAFWPGVSLDLTGAALVDLNFESVSIVQGQFDGTSFYGDTQFAWATFRGDATFDGATFQGEAEFDWATLQGRALFRGSAFQGKAGFSSAAFRGGASFNSATFQGRGSYIRAAFQDAAYFDRATFPVGGVAFTSAIFYSRARFEQAIFEGEAFLNGASFRGETRFNSVTFRDGAHFASASFQGGTTFDSAIFRGGAGFSGATFQGDVEFVGTTFGYAGFDQATFQGRALFIGAVFPSSNGVEEVVGAHVLHLDDPYLNRSTHRVWPDGLTVRPDPTDPTRGTLVRTEKAQESEMAVPPPSTDSRRTQRHGTDQIE